MADQSKLVSYTDSNSEEEEENLHVDFDFDEPTDPPPPPINQFSVFKIKFQRNKTF